uniref:Cytochrome c oxidase subunit 2 n=1 Tax=Anadara vellicata TaxID=935000 RepID=A0A0P0DQS3_9BIVA|nr:cytochrome c oxidase subunit II [Anadara vellicata]
MIIMKGSGGMSFSGQVGMSEIHSSSMEGIRFLWDHLLAGCVGVGLFVFFMMVSVLSGKNISLYSWAANKIEFLWTLVPAIILFCLAVPSLHFLYVSNQMGGTMLDVKIIGNQWYWGFEVLDHEYDSFMVRDEDLKLGDRRLLQVDKPLVVPFKTPIRFLVTGGDVIHSWYMPSLGSKIDGIPGRANAHYVEIDEPGVYHGGCAELCGVYHSHMPAVMEAVSGKDFSKWLKGGVSS